MGFWKNLAGIRVATGIRELSPHVLRHSSRPTSSSAAPIRSVQIVLGHAGYLDDPDLHPYPPGEVEEPLRQVSLPGLRR